MRKASDKPLLALIETSKANDMPLAVSLATMSDDSHPDEDKRFALQVAIVLVKATGFRVVKPRKPKIFKRGKTRVGPTFQATFADGEVTRMTTYCAVENLDWRRGENLSRAAYMSRHKDRPVPPIVAAKFEQDGKVLGTR
jgi:hypothetical protein